MTRPELGALLELFGLCPGGSPFSGLMTFFRKVFTEICSFGGDVAEKLVGVGFWTNIGLPST